MQLTISEPTLSRALSHVDNSALGFTIERTNRAWSITITYGAL